MSKRYDLDVGKRRMRKQWREFVKKRVFDRKKQRILCFPGEYGFEIEQVYRPLGFRDENIYGVERDPDAAKAIRQRYPKINLFEGDILDFVNQYEGGPFGVVSLDYCGHFSDEKLRPVMMLTTRGLIGDRGCVCLNLMAGREQADEKETLRSLYARYLQDTMSLQGKTISVEEAVALVNSANDEQLAEVRDNAVTQAFMSTLGYLMPCLRIAFQCELKKVRGTPIALQPNTKFISDDGQGKLVLENVKVGANTRMQVATQIKHEAIIDINEQLRDRGFTKIYKAWAEMDGGTTPSNFFEYHVGRTLVMAFYDKYGLPDFPVSLERYSYVSESGRRMISDFVEVRQFADVLDRMETFVAPFHSKADPDAHRFLLHPEPPPVSEPDKLNEYLNRLRRSVAYYAENIARHGMKCEAGTWKDRTDLGGGQAINIDEEKLKQRVIELVKKGKTTEEIAEKIPYLQPGTIRAIRAHVTMQTYAKKRVV